MKEILDRIDAYEGRNPQLKTSGVFPGKVSNIQKTKKGQGPIPFEKDKELLSFIKKVNADIAKMAKKSDNPGRRAEWIIGKLKYSL